MVASAQGGIVPRPIIQWAAPGTRGGMFASNTAALVCFGQGWYQVRLTGGTWKLDKERPDLPLAYYGPVSTLAQGVEAMLAGKSAVITVVAHGADNEAASFDLALNRQSLPGMVRLQRLKADMNMPGSAMSAANPAYLIGPGSVDVAQVPELIERLKSPDGLVRAEAADDLRTLGKKAKAAAPELAKLLNDTSPRA